MRRNDSPPEQELRYRVEQREGDVTIGGVGPGEGNIIAYNGGLAGVGIDISGAGTVVGNHGSRQLDLRQPRREQPPTGWASISSRTTSWE